MVEKALGERNFGFDSLKSRLNRKMEAKGIVELEAAPPPEESAYDREVGTIERWGNDLDPK
jgi:hypothetical protein